MIIAPQIFSFFDIQLFWCNQPFTFFTLHLNQTRYAVVLIIFFVHVLHTTCSCPFLSALAQVNQTLSIGHSPTTWRETGNLDFFFLLRYHLLRYHIQPNYRECINLFSIFTDIEIRGCSMFCSIYLCFFVDYYINCRTILQFYSVQRIGSR